MTTKTYKIKQLLAPIIGITAGLLIVAIGMMPTSASAATTSTFALDCTLGSVVVKKNTLDCSKGPHIVTVQGIGTKAEAKAAGSPYPTTTDLSIVSVNCGVSSPVKPQLGAVITSFQCQKKSITPTIKVTSTIKASPKASTKIPVYGVSTTTGDTIGGKLSSKDATACSPTDGSCSDCQSDANGNAAPGCPGCNNGTCVDQAANPKADCNKARGCDIIGKYVNPLVNLLSVSFGLIAVASLILGGVQYSMSAGDPQAVSNAKDRIKKTLLAIVAYFFIYALLQFLVPGGVFNRPT